MNKKYPTFFLTWFNKFPRVPSPGAEGKGAGAYIQDISMFLHTNINPHTSDLTPERWQQHAC